MQISFSQRQPSAQWEPLPILRIPGLSVWAWFRPANLPAGVTFAIPPELQSVYPGGFPFTVIDLLQSAGIPMEQFQSVSLFGSEWQPAAAAAGWFGQPVPPVQPGGNPEIMVAVQEMAMATPMMQVPMQIPMAQMPVQATYAAGEPDDFDDVSDADLESGTMYDRIEASWRTAIQMERQMAGLRQKLSSMVGTLGKLDRDLTPEERNAADREDRDAWHDARRWVRDLGARCHREVKAFDIGMTSAAGKRNWMEQQYNQVVKPRAATSDLDTVRREFESYRKDMVNLQKAMNAALQAANQNGTSRANRVLAVLRKKIQARRISMRQPLGGMNMDRSCRRKT